MSKRPISVGFDANGSNYDGTSRDVKPLAFLGALCANSTMLRHGSLPVLALPRYFGPRVEQSPGSIFLTTISVLGHSGSRCQ